MIIDNVPEQVSEDNVIELANEFTGYLENSGNLFFRLSRLTVTLAVAPASLKC